VIRVGVIGACGRMGRAVCAAVAETRDLELVAAIDRSRVGEPIGPIVGVPALTTLVSDELDELIEAETEVAVDFTHGDVVRENVQWAIAHAMHLVVGTTGLTDEDVERFGKQLEAEGSESNILIAPNFAVGAVLMQRFAEQAAPHFASAEVIELHHAGKADAPSGTSLATARRIGAARAGEGSPPVPTAESVAGARGADVEGVRIHSVRMPGLVAHQEVLFGSPGETLTIRHDSTDRSSFMPGILMAVRAVSTMHGLTVGIDPLL